MLHVINRTVSGKARELGLSERLKGMRNLGEDASTADVLANDAMRRSASVSLGAADAVGISPVLGRMQYKKTGKVAP